MNILYVIGLIFAICTLLGQLILLIELVKIDKLLKSDAVKNKKIDIDKEDEIVIDEWVEKFIDERLGLSEENARR